MNEEGVKIQGKWTDQEIQFLLDNYQLLTDDQIAAHLGCSTKRITNKRVKMDLMDKKTTGFIPPNAKKNRDAYVATLADKDKAEFLRKELRATAAYKKIKQILAKDEIDYYEERYVDFMMDPSIETLTSTERDAWHDMVMAQIRYFQYLKDEKTPDKDGRCYSKAKEIRECQEIVEKCRESLNVQRKQRLKNTNDQATNFTSVIRALKDPNMRREMGFDAAMLKFMTEQYYNDYSNPENPERTIFSGREEVFNINRLFKGGTAPSGLSSQFT